jgi:hypothetical protein
MMNGAGVISSPADLLSLLAAAKVRKSWITA